MTIKVSEKSVESASEAFDKLDAEKSTQVAQIFEQNEQPTVPAYNK